MKKSKIIAGLAVMLLTTGAAIADVKLAPFQPDDESKRLAAERSAVLEKLTPVTDEMLRMPPPGEWLQWRRTYDAHGFSPLAQINKTNVKTLVPAWTWSMPPGSAEFAPLVHDGVLFIWGTTDDVQAIDAKTGNLLWEYKHAFSGPAWPGIAGGSRRSFALYGDKLIFPTFDSHEIALDVHTGKVVWDHQVTDIKLPYRASAGPQVVNGKVIQGYTNCSRLQPGGCIIVAMDANDGHELWRIHTIPKPGEPGDETWKGVPYEKRQGASMWTTPSYDPDLNLLYFGTGNTYAWQYLDNGSSKRDPGHAGLYINSTLAINPDNGKMVWHYQHLPQDNWNLDWAFERPIMTLNVGGTDRKVVCGTGKIVWTDCMDAATGKWLFYHDDGLQDIALGADKNGNKIINPDVIPDLTRQKSNLICGQMKNWPASSYDASQKLLYIVVVTTGCTEEVPRNYASDSDYGGGEQSSAATRYNPKSPPGVTGRIDAINLQTNKMAWSVDSRVNMASSALATAGGLLFVGDQERYFRAYDSATGAVLWQTRLNHTVNATPISYSVDGKQYIAILAGKGQAGHNVTQETQWPKQDGAVLWVFALPDN